MLVECDYESWKIRNERYIRSKPLCKLIWRSIQNRPTPHPQITVIEGQGGAAIQVTRDKTDEEFTEIENNRELADIQATNIISQGLPRHVFNILNQMRTRKEIWDNLDIPAHQMNTKFVNNLPPYWEKYVTNVKNNKDISAITYVELYTYLESYEPHALKNLKKQERSSSIVDPLVYLASTTHYLTPTLPTNPPPSISSLTLPPQPAAQSSNDAMLATMNQIVNLLSGFQKQFPLTKNQLMTSSNSRSHAMVHDEQIVTETVQRKARGNVGNIGTRGTQSYGQVIDNKGKLVICYNFRKEGHVLRECKENKRVKDSQYFKDKMLLMEAKEKGAVLDAEAKAFLADVECTAPYDQPLTITTTNIFEVSHEDMYNYNVDEGPHAAAAFMANLSSTSGTNGATTSHVNEEEYLDSDVESDINDNTIMYHQYQLDSEVQDVPTEVSFVSPNEISMITILDDLRNQLDGHLKAKISQPTLYDGHALLKPTNTPIRVHDSEESLVQAEELSREQVYWLPVEELATQKSNPPKPGTLFVHTRPASSKAFTEQVIPFYEHVKELLQSLDENLVKEVTKFMQIFDELDKEYEQCVLKKKKLQIEKKNLLIQNECLITDFIAKDICSIVLASDRDRPLSEELRSNCVRENSKVIELEAEILKLQQMLAESDKRWMYAISSKYIIPPRRDNRVEPTPLPKKKQATFQEPPRPSNRPTEKIVVQQNKKPNIHVNVSTEVKPATRASKPMSKSNTGNHSTLPAKLRIQNDGFKVENVNLKRRYQELSTSNSHLRDTLIRKLTALTAKNAKLKSESLRKMHSKPIVPEKPKVLAPGMYAIREKPTTRASKPMSKSNTRNHSTLPAKREKARRVKDHHRNLNTHNHVDSRLNVKQPIVKPLELTLCVSSNSKVTMISRLTDYKLSNQNASSEGISDSGCSWHMTGDRSKLTNYVDKFIRTVRFKNDQFAAIVGYGDYKLENTIISKVYYVEGLSHNLFSFGQFCDGGLEVAFRQHTCHIHNNDMVDLLQGSRTINLYSISLNDMLASSPVCLLNKASSMNSWLWYRRLNHLNFGTLNELAQNDLVRGLPKLKYDKDHLCPSCQLGIEPNAMAVVHNGAGPKISALQSGRTRFELVNDPTTPSVAPSVKQLEELFQPLFDDDEEFPLAVQKPPVHVNTAQAP
nr:integrase, catalytic region, zinc finger, CCHC-type, peptidase aspartic, catalytic [Tanacetum cinerariifolium]